MGEGTSVAKLPSTVTVPIEVGQEYDFVVQNQHLRFFDKLTGVRTAPKSL